MKPEFPTFEVRQEYGDPDHRDTRHHRDAEPLSQQEEARDSAATTRLQHLAYRYELKSRFSRMGFPRTTVGESLCRDWHLSTHFANMTRGPRANLEGEP